MSNRIEQVISKGAGIAHELGAQLDGLVGVWNTLAEQHGEAGSLLKQAQADGTKRKELWPLIRAALRAHEQAELSEIYPMFRLHEGLRPLANRHEMEAAELSGTIDQMDRLGPSSAEFGPLLDHLILLVDAHVAEEERDIFPMAQAVLGKERSKELDVKFKATAGALKESYLARHQH